MLFYHRRVLSRKGGGGEGGLGGMEAEVNG